MWSSAIEARLRFFCPYPAEKACPLRPWLLACLIIRIKLIIAINEFNAYDQGGITCGAIEDPRKSSKAIDERVIINFRDKNGVIARFRDKNVVIVRFCDKNVECLYIYYGVIEE